jgi:hypothetical protein
LIGIEGSIRRVPGWPNEPLNSTFNRHLVSGFHASCNGGDISRKYSDDTIAGTSTNPPECGKCHVVVSDPWFSYMKPKIHSVEMDTLEKTNTSVFPTSRLACCISLKPWMNEMIVRMQYEANLHFLEESDDNDYSDSSIGGHNGSKMYPH